MRQAFIQGLLKRVRAQWRCQNIKRVSFSFLSSCLYHTHTCFLPFSLHSSFYLSIFPSLFIERTESSLSPPPPLFADWLGCFPRTEEAVSKQRQRQSGTCLQLFSLLLLFVLLLLLFSHFFFLRSTLKALFVCWVITGEHDETLLKAS